MAVSKSLTVFRGKLSLSIIGFVWVCVSTDLVMGAATNCLPHGCGDGVVDCAGGLNRETGQTLAASLTTKAFVRL